MSADSSGGPGKKPPHSDDPVNELFDAIQVAKNKQQKSTPTPNTEPPGQPETPIYLRSSTWIMLVLVALAGLAIIYGLRRIAIDQSHQADSKASTPSQTSEGTEAVDHTTGAQDSTGTPGHEGGTQQQSGSSHESQSPTSSTASGGGGSSRSTPTSTHPAAPVPKPLGPQTIGNKPSQPTTSPAPTPSVPATQKPVGIQQPSGARVPVPAPSVRPNTDSRPPHYDDTVEERRRKVEEGDLESNLYDDQDPPQQQPRSRNSTAAPETEPTDEGEDQPIDDAEEDPEAFRD